MHRADVNRCFDATWLVLFVMAVVPGCHNGQGCRSCKDIAPGAIPQPNGTYACQWIHAEKARAEQNNFVIYQYEWSYDGTKLTPTGQEHVARIARQLPQSPFPVAIEPSPDDHVNAARKAAVLESLASSGVPIDSDRVLLGRSEAEGLYGQEAPGIANRMLTTRGSGQGTAGGALGAGTTVGGTQGNTGTSSGIGVGVGMGMGSY